MVNKRFWFGILVLTLVFGMTVVGCDSGNGNGDNSPTTGGNGGTFTLTNIPLKFNGMYVLLEAEDVDSYYSDDYLESHIFLGSLEEDEITKQPRVSNGRISIPIWIETDDGDLVRYSGNDTVALGVAFFDWNDGNFESRGAIYFIPVTFSNGSATKSFDDGDFDEDGGL
jgi:hypothetical protein